jgi:hypothetical protein
MQEPPTPAPTTPGARALASSGNSDFEEDITTTNLFVVFQTQGVTLLDTSVPAESIANVLCVYRSLDRANIAASWYQMQLQEGSADLTLTDTPPVTAAHAGSILPDGCFSGGVFYSNHYAYFIKCCPRPVLGAIKDEVWFVFTAEMSKGAMAQEITAYTGAYGDAYMAACAAKAKLKEFEGKKVTEGHRLGAYYAIKKLRDGSKRHVFVQKAKVQ